MGCRIELVSTKLHGRFWSTCHQDGNKAFIYHVSQVMASETSPLTSSIVKEM